MKKYFFVSLAVTMFSFAGSATHAQGPRLTERDKVEIVRAVLLRLDYSRTNKCDKPTETCTVYVIDRNVPDTLPRSRNVQFVVASRKDIEAKRPEDLNYITFQSIRSEPGAAVARVERITESSVTPTGFKKPIGAGYGELVEYTLHKVTGRWKVVGTKRLEGWGD